jgi:hypothetical protein
VYKEAANAAVSHGRFLASGRGGEPQFKPSSEDDIHLSVSFVDNGKQKDLVDQTREGHHVTS